VDSGFDLSSLAPGWHRLTAAAGGGATTFFVDGAEVGARRGHHGRGYTTMHLDLSGYDIFEPLGICSQNICSVTR
jgi:hypothetical protein